MTCLPVEPKKKSCKDEFPPHSIIRCHEVTFVQSDFVRFSAAQDALEDGSADRNLQATRSTFQPEAPRQRYTKGNQWRRGINKEYVLTRPNVM